MHSRFFLALVLVFCGSLAACGGSSAQDDSDSDSSSSPSQNAVVPPVHDGGETDREKASDNEDQLSSDDADSFAGAGAADDVPGSPAVAGDDADSSAGAEVDSDIPGSPAVAGAVLVVSVAIIAESDLGSSSGPITFGQVFAKGDVPAGSTLIGTIGNSPVPIQVDPKATWVDGSLRHAVITARVSGMGDGATARLAINVRAPEPNVQALP